VTISKFPVDAPKQKVVKTLQAMGFCVIREREHISLERTNADGTKTPMTNTESRQNEVVDTQDYLHSGGHL
jgi:hypothetical protein